MCWNIHHIFLHDINQSSCAEQTCVVRNSCHVINVPIHMQPVASASTHPSARRTCCDKIWHDCNLKSIRSDRAKSRNEWQRQQQYWLTDSTCWWTARRIIITSNDQQKKNQQNENNNKNSSKKKTRFHCLISPEDNVMASTNLRNNINPVDIIFIVLPNLVHMLPRQRIKIPDLLRKRINIPSVSWLVASVAIDGKRHSWSLTRSKSYWRIIKSMLCVANSDLFILKKSLKSFFVFDNNAVWRAVFVSANTSAANEDVSLFIHAWLHTSLCWHYENSRSCSFVQN